MYFNHRDKPYDWGYTPITTEGETEANTMMDFGILRLEKGKGYQATTEKETAYVLMDGEVTFGFGEEQISAKRESLFHQSSICLHVPAQTKVSISAKSDVEIAITATTNSKSFPAKYYGPADTRTEDRGQGTMQETSTRIVRTVFDKTNAPDANLVVGEVINFPGKWSSYPPHHHVQPEIYHYRFMPENGFGACVLGDEILKAKHRTTVKIVDDEVHPQTAAPGYVMYYLWVIRHHDDNPYITPVFEPEHTWVMEDDADIFPDRRK